MNTKMTSISVAFLAISLISLNSFAQTAEQEAQAQQYVRQQMAGAKLVGSTYDPDVNGDLNLYDRSCLIPPLVSKYPYAWVANIRGSQSIHSIGCYKVDLANNKIIVFAPNDNKETSVPFANFGLNGNSSTQQASGNPFSNFIGALANGLNAGRATVNQYNQQPPQPLQPGVVQGRKIEPLPNNFKPKLNCTTTYNGGTANTTCY